MTSKKKIPYEGDPSAPIYLITDCPSEDDDSQGKIFTGRNGELLNHFLTLVGIDRSSCYIGSISQHRPKAGMMGLIHGSEELRKGYEHLTATLASNKPKIIVPCGPEALKYFTGGTAIGNWRGSVLPYKSSLLIPILPLESCFYDGQSAAIIEFDLRKIKRILEDGYKKPAHYFDTDSNSIGLAAILRRVEESPYISMDIESIRGTNHILCVGIAVDKHTAFCFRNRYPLGQGLDPEVHRIITEITKSAKEVVFHNGLFDTEVLGHYGLDFPNYTFDTMYAQRVIAPELPIGLDFCTSVYTEEPYYKDEGKENSANFKQTLWEYNCKDCIVTWEIRGKQEEVLEGDPFLKKTFQYQMSLVPVAKHFQESGMLLDTERVTLLKGIVQDRLDKHSGLLYAINGKPLLLSSPKQVSTFLYTTLDLPSRTSREGGVTTNEKAIVSLISYCQKEMETKKTQEAKQKWFFKLSALKLLLFVRGDEKLISSYLNVEPSKDGRIRSSYKISGTDTGRWAASNYIDGTGLNAQTMPRDGVSHTTTINNGE